MVTLRELLLQLAQNTEFQRFIKEMQDSNMSHANMVRVIASFLGRLEVRMRANVSYF